MIKSTSSAFPDVNVWLALTFQAHQHHEPATRWLRTTASSRIYFCRVTQMGLLRLLTTQAVMREEILSQPQAWTAYDAWYKDDDRVQFVDEPSLIERMFRELSRDPRQTAPGHWADAYVMAFAQLIGATLVTFDRHLARRAEPDSLLLE